MSHSKKRGQQKSKSNKTTITATASAASAPEVTPAATEFVELIPLSWSHDTYLDFVDFLCVISEILGVSSAQFFAGVSICLDAVESSSNSTSLTLLTYEPFMNFLSPKTTAQTLYLFVIALIRLKSHYGKLIKNLDENICWYSGIGGVVFSFAAMLLYLFGEQVIFTYMLTFAFAAVQVKTSIHLGLFGGILDGFLLLSAPFGAKLLQLIRTPAMFISIVSTIAFTMGQIHIVPNGLYWLIEQLDRNRAKSSRKSSIQSTVSV